MTLQRAILRQYMELSDSPTLKVVSKETGIQITRVFRLLNGSPMKLEEYLTFQDLIRQKLGFDSTLDELVMECRSKLSCSSLREVEEVLRRKLYFHELVDSQEKQAILN